MLNKKIKKFLEEKKYYKITFGTVRGEQKYMRYSVEPIDGIKICEYIIFAKNGIKAEVGLTGNLTTQLQLDSLQVAFNRTNVDVKTLENI